MPSLFPEPMDYFVTPIAERYQTNLSHELKLRLHALLLESGNVGFLRESNQPRELYYPLLVRSPCRMLDSTVVVHNKYQTEKNYCSYNHTQGSTPTSSHIISSSSSSEFNDTFLLHPFTGHFTLVLCPIRFTIASRLYVCLASLATSQSATPQPLPNGMNEALSRDGAEQS